MRKFIFKLQDVFHKDKEDLEGKTLIKYTIEGKTQWRTKGLQR